MSYFWSCNSNFHKKYFHCVLFFKKKRNEFCLAFFEWISSQWKKNPGLNWATPAAPFLVLFILDVLLLYSSSYQMLDFDFVDICLNLSQQIQWSRFRPTIIQPGTSLQNDKIFMKILNVIQALCGRMFQYYRCAIKALLSKNYFCFFSSHLLACKHSTIFRAIFIINSIINVNIIKIYTKNTYSVTGKYKITWTFNKVEYIIICV